MPILPSPLNLDISHESSLLTSGFRYPQDEKPSIQALERKTGYVETDNGKIVRGLKNTYKRHGTLNLFAALEGATGEVKTAFTQLKRREEFLQFMDQVVAETATDQELHVILDNYCTHKKCDAWLLQHPNVTFTLRRLRQVGSTKWKSGLAFSRARRYAGSAPRARPNSGRPLRRLSRRTLNMQNRSTGESEK